MTLSQIGLSFSLHYGMLPAQYNIIYRMLQFSLFSGTMMYIQKIFIHLTLQNYIINIWRKI